MRGIRITLLAFIVLLGGIANADAPPTSPADGAGDPEAAQAPPALQWPLEGTVLETMTTRKYTYVLVSSAGGEAWVAGPETSVKVGDTVVVPKGYSMANFSSNSLERVFERIYLVSSIEVKRSDE